MAFLIALCSIQYCMLIQDGAVARHAGKQSNPTMEMFQYAS